MTKEELAKRVEASRFYEANDVHQEGADAIVQLADERDAANTRHAHALDDLHFTQAALRDAQDERDAAIKRAEAAEANVKELCHLWRYCQETDSASLADHTSRELDDLVDRLTTVAGGPLGPDTEAAEEESRDNAHALEMAVNHFARAADQRDRALALVREWALTDEENRWDVTRRSRALLAEVDG